MKYNKLFIYIFFLVFSGISTYSTNINTDSLQQIVKNSPDSIKIKTLIQLSEYYIFSSSDLALTYAKQALSLTRKKQLLKQEAAALTTIGIIYYGKEEYFLARTNYEAVLKIAVEMKDSLLLARAYGNIGNTYMGISDYEDAVSYFKNALNLFESLKNINGMAVANGTIGNLYFNSENYSEALRFYNKSNEYFEKNGDLDGVALNQMNIGAVLKNQKEYKKSFDYLNKALAYFKENKAIQSEAQCLANIGNCYIGLKDYNQASIYLQDAITKFEALDSNEPLALSYYEMGNCFALQNKKTEAMQYYFKALELAKQFDCTDIVNNCFKEIASLYEKSKDYEKAYKYQQFYISYNDSTTNIEKIKSHDRLLTEFSSERKEKEIKIKEAELQKRSIELQKQKILIFSLIGGLVFFILLLYLLFNRYKLKQKANTILTLKNTEILHKTEEITTQRDEIEKQKFEIEKQHGIAVSQRDEIFRQKKDITDSIHYAKRIQTSLLPDRLKLREILNEGFCLFKPRDIVSGDFYWVNTIQNKTIIIAADCTGHGVPGAFMSIIGITFLNEIINEKGIIQPAQILNNLQDNLVTALKHSAEFDETKDGMDISIIMIDKEKNIVEFAGANNPLYIVSGSESTISCFNEENLKLKTQSLKLLEVKADRMPIGISDKLAVPFTNREIKVTKGDALYIFSDGFVDQFGEKENKKFKTKRFKELLLNSSDRPMDVQKALLDITFTQWKGSFEQVDDILIIGVRI